VVESVNKDWHFGPVPLHISRSHSGLLHNQCLGWQEPPNITQLWN